MSANITLSHNSEQDYYCIRISDDANKKRICTLFVPQTTSARTAHISSMPPSEIQEYSITAESINLTKLISKSKRIPKGHAYRFKQDGQTYLSFTSVDKLLEHSVALLNQAGLDAEGWADLISPFSEKSDSPCSPNTSFGSGANLFKKPGQISPIQRHQSYTDLSELIAAANSPA